MGGNAAGHLEDSWHIQLWQLCQDSALPTHARDKKAWQSCEVCSSVPLPVCPQRVVMLEHNRETGRIQFRHYAISLAPSGVSKCAAPGTHTFPDPPTLHCTVESHSPRVFTGVSSHIQGLDRRRARNSALAGAGGGFQSFCTFRYATLLAHGSSHALWRVRHCCAGG